MTEQLENSTDEIQQVVQGQIAAVREAVKELQRVLLESALEEYRNAVSPLAGEAAGLWKESQVLENACRQLTPRLEARRRLLATEIDQCIANGDDQGAAAKRAQVEQEEKSLSAMSAKIDQLTTRRQAILEEKRAMARQIFQTVYPLFPLASFGMLRATLDFLDALKKGLFDYVQTADIAGEFPYMLPTQSHVDGLLPSELPGSDRELFARLIGWFGAQRRWGE